MNNPNTAFRNLHLLRLGGISAILGGLLVVSFAAISGAKGVFFVPEIYAAEPVGYWIENLGANRQFVKWSVIMFIFGFSGQILTAFVLYQVLPENSWQKNLSMMAYAIAGAIILPVMALHQSTINYINSLTAGGEFSVSQIQQMVGSDIYRWMLVNEYFGPLFLVVLGTGFMNVAMWKASFIPRWLSYWGFAVSGLVLLSFFKTFIPGLGILGMAAPFHMIWFVVMGIFLLRKRQAETNHEHITET